ncbi:hypothetical protein ACHAXS_012860 [Conticribra weissflogii]
MHDSRMVNELTRIVESASDVWSIGLGQGSNPVKFERPIQFYYFNILQLRNQNNVVTIEKLFEINVHKNRANDARLPGFGVILYDIILSVL